MKQLIYIEIPTHLYNRRKGLYDGIKIVSWPNTVTCNPVFGCYIEVENHVRIGEK